MHGCVGLYEYYILHSFAIFLTSAIRKIIIHIIRLYDIAYPAHFIYFLLKYKIAIFIKKLFLSKQKKYNSIFKKGAYTTTRIKIIKNRRFIIT